MTQIRRRAVLAGTAAVALPFVVRAQEKPSKLTIVSHRVHQLTATEGQGGDVTAAWRARNGIELEWVTLDLDAIHDRLFREASLSRTQVDIGFILNTRATPDALRLFEPLDPFMAKAPIENFADMQQNFVENFRDHSTAGGGHVAIPYRHAATGMHYNEQIFAERGVAGPPVLIDDLLPVARKLTHTDANGTPIAALGFEGDNYTMLTAWARAYGGDFITDDLKVVADQPPMVKALTLLRTLYAEGHLPKNMTAMSQNDLIGAMQGGQLAMVSFPWGRTLQFNDPKASKYPGKFKTTFLPNSPELQAKGAVICTAEFWAMAIPRNSQHKDLAWDLIRELSLPQNTIAEALNGNGPVRVSAYADPRLQRMLPYAAQEAVGMKWARVPLPAFPASAKAKDIFVEEMQAAMLGMQTPEVSANNIARRIRPLLPA
jgi:multiple sugar transport system substrate-binding protein